MFRSVFSKSFLAVLSIACAANAYIVPGDTAPLPGYHEPFPGDNSSPCDNPYEPCQQPGNPYEPGYPNQPGYPGNPGQPSYGSEIKRIYIGRSVRNERLHLLALSGIGQTHRGWEVVSVRARTRPDSPSTTIAQLTADGRVLAQQRNPGYQIQLYPNSRAILGDDIRTLQLAISGSTFIEEIEIELAQGNGGGYPPHEPPYNPPQPPYNPPHNPPGYGEQRVDIAIHRNTYGNDRIDLTQYVNLSQYRGLRIREVVVTGRADFNVSIVNLLINSFQSGQAQFSNHRQSQSIWLNQQPVIGHEVNSISLHTQGNMLVERVTLVLSY